MIYENIENINNIIKLLKEHNIKDLVISPGGTNIPLVKKVQDDSYFSCYSIIDERSALYFAIGIYLQTGKPVVMICTSAQATRNYIPGLTEAYYKRVPILAITMEKHRRFKYQEYMQAPDQTSLPNDAIKKSFELPFVRDINDIYHSKRVINEAILELTNNGNGPVQLSVPWLDFNIDEIEPRIEKIDRYLASEVKHFNLNNKKILIVIGEHRVFTEEEKNAIGYFCNNTNCAIYTNHLSNFNNDYTINGNLLLSVIDDKRFEMIKPDILITIGGQTGDYPLYLRFSKTMYTDIEHWRVCEDGKIIDTYDKLRYVFKGKIQDFFANVKQQKIEHTYINEWKNELKTLKSDVSVPFSNVSIAQELHKRMPKNSIIQFSILNSLRVWNMFELDNSISCYSNVGAFGIDGGMSTLIGQSVVNDNLAFMIIGDLAFLYDINSLSIRHIRNNLRIIIINNNGGIEFKYGKENKKDMNRYIAAGDHYKNAEGWALTCGFKYIRIESIEELKNASEVFLNESNKPIIIEAFVSDENESIAYHKFIEENKCYSISGMLKKNVKSTIKKIINRR